MMNNRGHLPAGQPLQGGVEMVPGPNGGPRRGGRHSQHFAAHSYHQHPSQVMYPPAYMSPYGTTPSPYYVPSPYQNGGMPSPAYMGYPPAAYNRSPPSMPQYVPMAPQSYRPPQHSPAVPSPYQAPPPLPGPALAPAPALIPPPQTPSSTHSSYAAPPPVATPPAETTRSHERIPSEPYPEPEQKQQPQATTQIQHTAPQEPRPSPFVTLPWYSRPDQPFPKRTTKYKRRKRILNDGVEVVDRLGSQQEIATSPTLEEQSERPDQHVPRDVPSEQTTKVEESATAVTPKLESKKATPERPPRSETPSTQGHPSDYTISSSPTTPSSAKPATSASTTTVTPTTSTKPASRTALPAVPVLPALPKAGAKDSRHSAEKAPTEGTTPGAKSTDSQANLDGIPSEEVNGDGDGVEEHSPEAMQFVPAPAPAPLKPKLWTTLFSKPGVASNGAPASVVGDEAHTNGASVPDVANAALGSASSFARANANSLAEALQAYRVGSAEKLAFLEPRGLVNTGNMCYMNSVLQVLIFCVPFYEFLNQVGRKATYSFKSETPLLDAMVMFMREYNVIDSAVSVDQLRRRLKNEELEQYGEPFTPEFVYDTIRNLPRFASMRRGHQQDAEEFLGFLLEGLLDECAQVLRTAPTSSSDSSVPSPTMSSKTTDGAEAGDDWLEVGPRQRPAITRSSGHIPISTPVTKIFGGQLRSELRVPGLKNSVTLEPYQPLQLDIGGPEIRNIVDALKGLTRPETLHGDFNSPHGKDARATKQVFIETLPPVLILHLKRFQFDAEGNGTVKIWKKVGYPLELEIPREIFSRQKRNMILAEGTPKYRLIAVVYHHGKNASGGHYTVDVRRQDGREWIRLDDTVIKRLRTEDVAEGGMEEDVSKLAQGDARRENGSSAANNRFGGMNDEDTGDDEGWKQAPAGGKKWSSVVNGGGTPPANGPKAPKQFKDNIKDNKVAYLLFYERM